MVADAERLAREDAAHVERIESRNELEAAVYAAKDFAATSGKAALAEVVRVVEAWLDVAPATTPAAAFKAKLAEVEAALASA